MSLVLMCPSRGRNAGHLFSPKYINIESSASPNFTKFKFALQWAPNNAHAKYEADEINCSADICSIYRQTEICGISKHKISQQMSVL